MLAINFKRNFCRNYGFFNVVKCVVSTALITHGMTCVFGMDTRGGTGAIRFFPSASLAASSVLLRFACLGGTAKRRRRALMRARIMLNGLRQRQKRGRRAMA